MEGREKTFNEILDTITVFKNLIQDFTGVSEELRTVALKMCDISTNSFKEAHEKCDNATQEEHDGNFTQDEYKAAVTSAMESINVGLMEFADVVKRNVVNTNIESP